MRASTSLGVLVASTLLAAPAAASPLLELAGGVGGQGGFSGRVVPGDAASTYYNPALMTDAPAGLTLGVFVLSEQIGIAPSARPGTQYNVPLGVENASHANGSRWSNYPIPTQWLQQGRAKSATNDALPARPRQAAGTGQDVF